jgi:hypothetical protein
MLPSSQTTRRLEEAIVVTPEANWNLVTSRSSVESVEPGTSVELNAPDWPTHSHFDERFVALGIFFLGPYGTCVKRLASLELAPR